ncbi:hypothetical protein Salat_1902500 [Sesamum alatum]|uniref:Uncharacterized protein n=1 Tax=Sesamum alatum TaxID=300844 RepID=A0AAE2CIB2_9LAMI|nr:hypothetical protein Salat_1902500 [Sesamum alatum]
MQGNNQQPQTRAQQGGANKPTRTRNQAGRTKIRAHAFALGGEEVTDPTTVIEGTIRQLDALRDEANVKFSHVSVLSKIVIDIEEAQHRDEEIQKLKKLVGI